MHERPLVLNHVEMVYRPGEADVAIAALEIMGLTVDATKPPWLVAHVDGQTGNGIDNVLYASELTPAQQAFEAVFERSVGRDDELREGLARYREVRQAHPQFAFHFGLSVPTHEDWLQRIARIQEASRSHELLAGRIGIAGVFEPGMPDAVTPQHQAFVRTDVLSSEMLALGLQIELQWTPLRADGTHEKGMLDTLPDLATLR